MPIDQQVREYISKQGHITVDRLMKEALTASPNSYYKHKNLLGAKGDFITSPEISQVFGEAIGLWCIEFWEKLGKPQKISLVELGPGRGLLMRNLLKVAQIVPEFYEAVQVELVDINPNFIEWQKKNLENFDINIRWLSDIADISKDPSLFIANEFFDALPIKQFIKVKETWFETILVSDPNDGKIKFDKIALNKTLNEQFLNDYPTAYDGAVVEESLESLQVIRTISNHIKVQTGAALIIDYGYYINNLKRTRHQYNSTLQAIKNHQFCPVLDTLGEADLSAHVDFFSLEKTAKEYNIKTSNFLSQRGFLINYGILQRAEMLKKSLEVEAAKIIDRQVERLISPQFMGELFKVLCLS